MGWAIDGPVPTEVADGRRMLYSATSGAEGVGGVSDLKVAPLATPGQGIRVLTGTALIRSAYGSAGNETYQGAVSTQQTVATTPTPSSPSTGRSDLVVMQVEDPWAVNSPWPTPATPATYDAFPIRIIEGVPAGTTRLQDVPGYQTRTAVTLARIDIPASTGTITAGMIKDLRKVARPNRDHAMRVHALTGTDTSQITTTTAYPAGGQTWPTAVDAAWTEIDIPSWASRARITMIWGGVRIPPGNAFGYTWVQIAQTVHPQNVKTQATAWDTPGLSQNSKYTHFTADEVTIPPELRGTRQKFYPRANRTGGTASAGMILDYGSSVMLLVDFYEQAI